MEVKLKERLTFGAAAARSVGLVAAVNVALAVVALLKDICVAAYLGTSAGADAFTLAFFIPDMIGNNLVAAAIGTSCVPVFARLSGRDERSLRSAFFYLNFTVAALSAGILAFLLVFRGPIVGAVGRGFSPQTKETCVRLLELMLPTVVLYPLMSIGVSLLQVKGIFVRSALAPVIFNAVFLFSVLALYRLGVGAESGVYGISAAVLAAECIVAVYVCFLVVRSLKGTPRFFGRAAEFFCGVKRSLFAVRLSLGYGLILLFSQAALYFERYLSSSFGEGSVSALNYAYRIAQFPVWVFAAAITAVAFPGMSKAMDYSPGRSKKILADCIVYMLMINLPIMTAFFILRVPITALLFERGSFDARSVGLTSGILGGYALAILGQSVLAILVRYIVAANRAGKAAALYAACTALNLAADFGFVRLAGLYAVGYGSALASTVLAALLLGFSGLFGEMAKSSGRMLKILGADAVVAAVCLEFRAFWMRSLQFSPFYEKLLLSCACAAACGILYLIVILKARIVRPDGG